MHVLDFLAEGFEIGKNVGAALDNFLDGFFLGAGDDLAFLERHAGVAANDGDIAIAEEAFGDERGGGVGKNVGLILAVDAHDDFDVVHALGRLAGHARHEANGFDVADVHAVEADGSAGGEAGNFREEGFQAVFGAEKTGAGNVEDADGQDQQADKNEQANAQFRPGDLFALGHPAEPPCTAKVVRTLYRNRKFISWSG